MDWSLLSYCEKSRWTPPHPHPFILNIWWQCFERLIFPITYVSLVTSVTPMIPSPPSPLVTPVTPVTSVNLVASVILSPCLPCHPYHLCHPVNPIKTLTEVKNLLFDLRWTQLHVILVFQSHHHCFSALSLLHKFNFQVLRIISFPLTNFYTCPLVSSFPLLVQMNWFWSFHSKLPGLYFDTKRPSPDFWRCWN